MDADGAPPDARPRTARRAPGGVVAALAVLGGLTILGTLVIVAIALVVLQSPTGRRIAGAVGESVSVMQKAQKAPGTKELRGMGCQTAMVIDAADMQKIAQKGKAPADPSDPVTDEPRWQGNVVTCGVPPWGHPPSCDEIAETYIGAVGEEKRPFVVTSTKTGDLKPTCSALYDRHGKLVRALGKTPSAPPSPSPTPTSL